MLIGTDYKIESDTMNVILYQKVTIKDRTGKKGLQPKKENIGKEYWDVLGYFSTIQAALRFMVKHNIQGAGLDDFAAVSKRQDELFDLIKQLDL